MNSKSLLKLCTSGDLDLIRKSFEPLSKTEIELIKDSQSASCLHYAARYGFTDVLNYFIFHKNITPFLVSRVGATCLHDAAVKGQISIVDWILKHTDLNLFSKDTDGATPAHLAAKFDQLELIEWILTNHGTDSFKEQTYNGATCLHFACASGSLKAVMRIVSALPNLVNIQTMNGESALFLAVQEDSYVEVKFLISRAGANPHLKAVNGMSLVHVAAQNGGLKILRYLVEECGMSVNELDFSGLSSLHYACVAGSADVVAYLLVKNTKVGADKNGNTALHSCALIGNVESARLLIASGCDVSAKNSEFKTCLDIASSNGHDLFTLEFQKFANKPQKAKYLKDISNTTHLSVTNSNDQNVLSPLNSLISLKSVPTSTPQDFLTIISDSKCEPDESKTTQDTNSEVNYYNCRHLGRNQSLLKIVSNSDSHKTPQTISQNERSCVGGGKYLKKSTDSQIQSATLVELNNCIAQFEKFSYFSDENLKTDKDFKFHEISNKLKEIKNTLLETKSKQLHQSFSSLTTSCTENSSSTTFPELNLTETIKTPVAYSNQLLQAQLLPPPPPPVPVDIFSKYKPASLNFKRQSAEAPENARAKTSPAMRNSASTSFMDELQKKLHKSETLLKQQANDPNNNGHVSENLNITIEKDLKRLSIQRLQQASEVPEWKQRLIEKKRMSRTNLNGLQ